MIPEQKMGNSFSYSKLIEFYYILVCRTLVCWVYALTKYPEQLLNLPYLNEYNNSIEQPYMERYLRKGDIKPKDDLLYKLLETNFT